MHNVFIINVGLYHGAAEEQIAGMPLSGSTMAQPYPKSWIVTRVWLNHEVKKVRRSYVAKATKDKGQ